MARKLIEIEDVKSVLKRVGLKAEECDRCLYWSSPELEEPLNERDSVVGKLTPEEESLLRCMGYVYNEREVIDTLRLRALRETFWTAVRSLHNLPTSALAVKEGKYIVAVK